MNGKRRRRRNTETEYMDKRETAHRTWLYFNTERNPLFARMQINIIEYMKRINTAFTALFMQFVWIASHNKSTRQTVICMDDSRSCSLKKNYLKRIIEDKRRGRNKILKITAKSNDFSNHFTEQFVPSIFLELPSSETILRIYLQIGARKFWFQSKCETRNWWTVEQEAKTRWRRNGKTGHKTHTNRMLKMTTFSALKLMRTESTTKLSWKSAVFY